LPPPSGENIIFTLNGYRFGTPYELDKGDAVMSTKRITDSNQGDFRLSLTNDNKIQSINVSIKVIAVVISKNYEIQPYTEEISVPRKEMKTYIEPIIKSKKVLVHLE
jgi:hypothetical protein